MSTQFKQRVPIARTQDERTDVFITVEWLRMLNARIAEISGATGGETDPDLALIKQQIATLRLQITALQAKDADFEARIRRLEANYQT